jgi:hypothetical protein
VKPVDVRGFFLKKASDPGIVGCDASSFDLTAISSGELGDGGELERVVAELLFIDHRRFGIFRWAASGNCKVEAVALLAAESGPALSGCDPTRFKKLDMVRLKFEDEPKVERLEESAPVGSRSGEGVTGVGVVGAAARGVSCGLLGAFGGVVADVSTTRGGLEPSAAGC